MSSEDTIKYKQMIRNIPKLESIPKLNKIIYTEGKLKNFALFGVLALYAGAFVYKICTDMVPAMTNPTTKKFMAVPDFTSRQVHVYFREIPNKAHEY